MKNTILIQIIKKVILAEQGGFTEVPDSNRVKLNTQKKTGNKTVINKVIKKVDPKKPLKITPIPDVLLSPTPYRNPHFIYSKTADGIWRYEYLDAATESIKSGIVTNSDTEKQLNKPAASGYIKWTGKYGTQQEKLGKKEWLHLMDMHDPMFPKKSMDPMFSSETKTILGMAVYYGGIALAGAVAVWLASKLGLHGVRKAGESWAKGSGTLKVKSLSGVSTIEAEELSRQAKVAWMRNEISYKEMGQLQKAFNNPVLRLKSTKNAFNAAYEMMVRGDMTMSEFITYMPSAYRNNEKLQRLLLEYEARLNEAFPNRRAKWAESATKYAEKNAQFSRQLDNLFDLMGVSRDNPFRMNPNSGNPRVPTAADYAAPTFASAAADIAMAALKMPGGVAAAYAKISKGIDDAAIAVSGEVKSIQDRQFFTMGAYDPTEVLTKLTTINPITQYQWAQSLAKGNNKEITTLLKDLAKLKKKETAISKIKNFAGHNNWNVTKDKEIIEEFMLHVLKNFYSKKR